MPLGDISRFVVSQVQPARVEFIAPARSCPADLFYIQFVSQVPGEKQVSRTPAALFLSLFTRTDVSCAPDCSVLRSS